jgi:hypothetical protein
MDVGMPHYRSRRFLAEQLGVLLVGGPRQHQFRVLAIFLFLAVGRVAINLWSRGHVISYPKELDHVSYSTRFYAG